MDLVAKETYKFQNNNFRVSILQDSEAYKEYYLSPYDIASFYNKYAKFEHNVLEYPNLVYSISNYPIVIVYDYNVKELLGIMVIKEISKYLVPLYVCAINDKIVQLLYEFYYKVLNEYKKINHGIEGLYLIDFFDEYSIRSIDLFKNDLNFNVIGYYYENDDVDHLILIIKESILKNNLIVDYKRMCQINKREFHFRIPLNESEFLKKFLNDGIKIEEKKTFCKKKVTFRKNV